MLFTSLLVVASLLLLGTALHALLAKSLYTQQLEQAKGEVERLRDQASTTLVGSANASTTQVRQRIFDQLSSGTAAPKPGFTAVILVGPESTQRSDERIALESIPPQLINAVFTRSEIAYVYMDAPPGIDSRRTLVLGAPIRSAQGDYEAYFFYPTKFQEDTLGLLTSFLMIVGVGLLAAVVIMTAISIGRVLKPIQRARDVAEAIAAGNLTARLPEATTQDDFGRLAESFNRMTEALAQKIGELENVSSLQARFVSDVSHELRTPLATVRMAADYIHAARSGLPPDAQRAAVLLERELERFENLLEDLLEISRFDAGVIALDPVEVDLATLLDEVVDALDAIAHGRRVKVSLHVDRSQGPPLVAADPRRLDRVFSNLVKNAIEHTHDGHVKVEVARRGGEVVVSVEDEGEGIPAEDLPHIFERFYRADVHRARTLGGTGLGLAIALENVNLHKGSVTVTSEVSRGSAFTVVLPGMERAGKAAVAGGNGGPPTPPSDSEPEVVVGG
ncbi:MAG TPA: HAMP domain-containing sensor histidine kinase [Actinomycetes bacterium]